MDWSWLLQQLVDLLKALIGGLAGSWLFIKILLPRMMKSTARETIDEAAEHPKIKPLLARLKTLLEKAEQLDFQEIVDMAKGLRVIIETQNKKGEPSPPSTPPPKKNES